MATPAASILANKLQSNITIGLVNWYCYIPGIHYNGSWAMDYPEAYNETQIPYGSNAWGVWIMDAAARAAAGVINSRADILPNNYVNVKRFSDCGAWWPTVNQDFSGHTTGFAMSVLGTDVGETHKDVLALTGQQYSTVAKATSEVLGMYHIPICSTNSAAPSLSDKNNFPYFFRLIASSGLGNYVGVLLQSWDVRRIVVLSQSDDLLGSGYARDIQMNTPKFGVSVQLINLKGKLTQDMVNYAKSMILTQDMRYMYIAGQVDFVSKVYFSLSLVGMISPKYVYLGTNVPKKITTDMSLLSPNLSILNQNVTLMAQYMQGFISLVSLRPPATNPPWLQPFYDQFSSVAKLDKGFADDLYLNSGENITTYYAVSNAFDCVMTLAMGFDKLLKDNPKYSSQNLASRSLSQYSNYTQFLNTSYTGLTSSSLNLNSLGDLISPYYVYSYTGQARGNSFVSQSFAVTDIGGTQIGYFNGSSPIFFGGSTIPPPDGPAVIQLNYLVNDAQSSNGKAIIAVTTLGLVLSGCTLAFFVVFRNDKKMKMTSVPECIVTIVGSAFCYISLAFHLNGVTRSSCVARIWLAVFGYMLMIQPIIMKNSRLYIVLKSKKRLDGVLLTLIGRCVVAGGILIELGLLSNWAATSNTGPFQMVVSYNAFDICNSVNKSGSIAIEILQGFTLFIHCLLFVLAYFLKDADPKFNESPALSTVGAMNAILYAVMVILPSNPTINMDLIQCICIWLGTTLTLLIFFGSKMYEVIFDTIAEKGLLKMSIKSSFEAGKSTASGFGAKSGFAAAKPKTQNSTMNPSKISTQDISKQDSSRQDSSRAKSNSNLRESEVTSEGSAEEEKQTSATAKSQLSRAKSGRELVPPRSGIPTAAPLTGQTLKKAHSTKDMKSHHRPCHCKQILGIHVFKIKTAKTQIIWNAWNGGVCYFNNTRKRTWMSIATLDKVHTITIMSTVRCERITGVNQVSISDFPSFKFHVILEFKDVKTLESFMSEFQAHKTFMLTQRD